MAVPLRVAQKIWGALCADDRTLVEGTLQALVDHGLENVAAETCQRLFAKEQDSTRVVEGAALAPFVTLVLHELRWLATVPGWPVGWRQERAHEALTLCGF